MQETRYADIGITRLTAHPRRTPLSAPDDPLNESARRQPRSLHGRSDSTTTRSTNVLTKENPRFPYRGTEAVASRVARAAAMTRNRPLASNEGVRISV
jgi:hypothetical protein